MREQFVTITVRVYVRVSVCMRWYMLIEKVSQSIKFLYCVWVAQIRIETFPTGTKYFPYPCGHSCIAFPILRYLLLLQFDYTAEKEKL